MDKILIIGANRYNFEDGDRTIKGVSLHYLETYDQEDPNKRGLLPMKTSTTEQVFESLVKAPCFAEAEFSRRPGKGGKAETYVRSVKVLKSFDLLGSSS